MGGKTSKEEELESDPGKLCEGYSACCDTKRKGTNILKECVSQTYKEEHPGGNSHSSWNEVFKADQNKWDKI
jgi:hypothetical protein